MLAIPPTRHGCLTMLFNKKHDKSNEGKTDIPKGDIQQIIKLENFTLLARKVMYEAVQNVSTLFFKL